MKERKVKAFVMMCIFLALSLGSVITGAALKMPVQYFYVIAILYGAFAFFAALFVWGVVIADKIFQDGALKGLLEKGKELLK
jgi:hypothetical protein